MSEGWGERPEAQGAHALVQELQRHLVDTLERTSAEAGQATTFEPVSWLRDEGRHGGGTRFQAGDTPAFDRASVNVSHVHYDDQPHKRLGSATALSAIVHPRHPRAPSMHVHVSYTALRDRRGYWRVMADLNPSLPHEPDRQTFEAALEQASGPYFGAARAQGDKYFSIPALQRHRGVCHFYLEEHDSGDWAADRALAEAVERAAIDAYGSILARAWAAHPDAPTSEESSAQLAYHTLYLFQVLTLDRGTTSGLLVHRDNDLGILGSLPSHVDPERLLGWAAVASPPQDELVRSLAAVFPAGTRATVTPEAKRRLADVVRGHYAAHPEALALQAAGDVVPPTVANHVATR